jgi:hypothetical protein
VAVGFEPKNSWAQNSLAWFLATCPDARYRNGADAVKAAKIACELTAMKDAESIDTLAAALAEAADFEAAITTEEKAIGLLAKTETTTRADYQARLELYRKKTPYRETNP